MAASEPPHRARAAAAAVLWNDAAWPVATGALVAIGLLDVVELCGSIAAAAVIACVWVFLATAIFCAGVESKVALSTAIRIAGIGAVASVSAVGVVELLPVAGWILVGFVVASSPWATQQLAHLSRAYVTPLLPVRQRATALRQAAVDREFARLVKRLTADPSRRDEQA